MPLIKPTRGLQLNRSHALARGLVLALAANEGTGKKVFDFSGYNGSKATFNGNAAWVAGNRGWSIDFSSSGSDYIKINPTLGFGTSGTFVWSALLDSIISFGGHISIKDSSAANCLYIFNNLSNIVRAMHYNTADSAVIDINTAVSTNKWMTIAYTWSPSAGKLYLDGVLKAQDASITGTLRIPSEIWIGSERGSTNRGLDGRISYVYGYNRVLSQEEIGQLHKQPFAMFEPVRSAGSLYSLPVVVWLAGAAQAQSTAAAMLSRDLVLSGSASSAAGASALCRVIRRLSGAAGGTTAAGAALTVSIHGVWFAASPEIERWWLREALFNGVSSNAVKLGTTLTSGWFWVRTCGCSALYRGSGMEQMDFVNILAAEQDAREIGPPGYLRHESSSRYFYVVRRFNRCGYQEQTIGAAARVSIDADGELAGPQPNSLFTLKLKQVDGNQIQLVWFYCPLEQKAKPACFKIYQDGGAGQINYENPIAAIDYKGRRYYSHKSGGLEAGRYLFAIRAEAADGTKHSSSAEARFDLSDSRPDSISILSAQAI